MFLPIGDTPNPKRFTPYVNYSLIALNVVLYLFVSLPASFQQPDPSSAQFLEYIGFLQTLMGTNLAPEALAAHISAYDVFIYTHGFKPAQPELTDLFFSLFLHGGFGHLAGNMLFLWIYGDNVEHRLGRIPYLIIYMAWGILATLSYTLLSLDSPAPLVGASGAISGVLGYYFILFPKNQVKVFVFFFPFIMNVILVPARLVLGVYLVLENIVPALLGPGSSVAYGAHIGGFVFGLAFALGGEKWTRPAHKPFRKPKPKANTPSIKEPLQNLRVKLGELDDSRIIEALGMCSPEDFKQLSALECATLSELLLRQGLESSAFSLIKRSLQMFSNGTPEELAQLYLSFGRMRLTQDQETMAYQHLLTALEQDPSDELRNEIITALNKIDVYKRRN